MTERSNKKKYPLCAAALALTSALPERAFVGEYERRFGTVSDEAAEPEKAG